MNRLVTANDIAVRDGFLTPEVWFKNISEILVQKKKLSVAWNGRTVGGKPIHILVDFGRVMCQCECGGCEYVSLSSPIFYCMSCGNNGSGIARPVEFPDDWEKIEKALVARPIRLGAGMDWVAKTRRSSPEIQGLPREWRWGVKAIDLEKDNIAKLGHKGRGE